MPDSKRPRRTRSSSWPTPPSPPGREIPSERKCSRASESGSTDASRKSFPKKTFRPTTYGHDGSTWRPTFPSSIGWRRFRPNWNPPTLPRSTGPKRPDTRKKVPKPARPPMAVLPTPIVRKPAKARFDTKNPWRTVCSSDSWEPCSESDERSRERGRFGNPGDRRHEPTGYRSDPTVVGNSTDLEKIGN